MVPNLFKEKPSTPTPTIQSTYTVQKGNIARNTFPKWYIGQIWKRPEQEQPMQIWKKKQILHEIKHKVVWKEVQNERAKVNFYIILGKQQSYKAHFQATGLRA